MATVRCLSNTPVPCTPARTRTASRETGPLRLPTLPLLRLNPRSKVACQAISQDEMTQAEKRWESQIKEGRVRNVTCKGAGKLMQEGWTLLDVRPPNEVKLASVEKAVEVPLFVPDTSMSIPSLLKQMSAFGMGGWWLGGTHMAANDSFLTEVQAKVPKNAKVIIACQKGLRSLAACEQLSRAGYQTLAWINGGFDTAKEGDLAVKDSKDLRYAGIGGVSAMLGWTEVQQQERKKDGEGPETIIRLGIALLVLDALVLGVQQINYMMNGN